MPCAASRECPAGWVSCGAGGRCVGAASVCDGRADCDDGTDELDCDCPPTHFRCADGPCVALSARCDGTAHCADASDERACPHATCAFLGETALPCARTPSCYLPQWRCDRTPDCSDGSDEENCPEVDDDEEDDEAEACGLQQFACGGGRGKPGAECVPLAWRCDGRRDCSDGSDETEHCGKTRPPAAASVRALVTAALRPVRRPRGGRQLHSRGVPLRVGRLRSARRSLRRLAALPRRQR